MIFFQDLGLFVPNKNNASMNMYGMPMMNGGNMMAFGGRGGGSLADMFGSSPMGFIGKLSYSRIFLIFTLISTMS